jgi:hypothetical protein
LLNQGIISLAYEEVIKCKVLIRLKIGIRANWIRLGQDRVQWQAFVNTVMNLWVP